jgi:hypothetical protein
LIGVTTMHRPPCRRRYGGLRLNAALAQPRPRGPIISITPTAHLSVKAGLGETQLARARDVALRSFRNAGVAHGLVDAIDNHP